MNDPDEHTLDEAWGEDPAVPDQARPTGEQLQAVIIAALDQCDIRAVDAALTVMAVVDPHRAERVLETLRLGLALTEVSS